MNRDHRIDARISAAERALLDRIAEAEYVKPSEAIRLALRAEGRRRGLWPPEWAVEPQAETGDAGD